MIKVCCSETCLNKCVVYTNRCVYSSQSQSVEACSLDQQLLFLNSPFSVMESLVGLVGDRPFRRLCML